MKILYYSFKGVIGLVLLFFLGYLGYRSYQSWCNPITILQRDTNLTVTDQSSYKANDQFSERIYTDIILNTGSFTRCTLSLPKHVPKQGLPCIIVIAGLDTGKQSLNYISDQSGFAIISYEYPQLIRNIRKKRGLFQIRSIRQNVFTVPSQIVGIAKWANSQPWCFKPASIAGFSFGAVFTPAIYHLAQVEKVPLGPGVIGYGGADLYQLFYANLSLPAWLRYPTALLANYLFRPIEPSLHAPYLQNDFLIINGTQDKLIPLSSAKKLQAIIPEPKKIINLKTEHMYPENTALLNQLLELTKQFLD